MKKLLIGNIGKKVNRTAFGTFVSKKDAKIVEYQDGKCFIIGKDEHIKRLEKEFGKDYKIVNLSKEHETLENKKLTSLR